MEDKMQTMTIQEVASILEVNENTIQHHVRNLYPGLMVNGKKTYLDQEQVTEIKKRMQPTKALVGSKTELEIMEGGLHYIQWLQAKVEEQRNKLEDAQPKIQFHDTIVSGDDCFTMSETVKLLKTTLGRNKFYALLKADMVLMQDREPYQEYIQAGYFQVTLKHVGHGGVEKVTLVTGKGLAWLRKRYDHIILKGIVA
jgi:phage antirepressor YoqD-like protein